MVDIEIREFVSGHFQVWRGDEVLRPERLTWEGSHQAHHDFMYYDDIEDAEADAQRVVEKETLKQVHTIH